MIFGIISLVICTVMTFEKELVDNNSSSVVTTIINHTLKKNGMRKKINLFYLYFVLFFL